MDLKELNRRGQLNLLSVGVGIAAMILGGPNWFDAVLCALNFGAWLYFRNT